MKRFLTFLLSLVLTISCLTQPVYAAPAWPGNLDVAAEAGVVIDARSGAVLYGKNMHLPYYPASITKIMTALVVIENCNLDDIVTFSHDAVYGVESGSSSAGLDVGDQMTVRDCLYAMLLKSANEVANALAEHTAGSVKAFASMMNQKAKSLGCTDTHFNNPSGLNDPRHYTSAYDMALIAQAAFQNETFVTIDSSLYYDLPVTKRNPEGFRVYPGHRMMKKNTAQYYPGIIGGKTGYTMSAGNTLVTCAERDGMKLIAVILNGHQTHYTDTKAMLDFGFSNFRSLNIADMDTTYATIGNDMTIAGLPTTDLSVLRMQDNCRVTLPNSADISDAQSSISYELPDTAPAHAIARITYQYNDRQVGAAYLLHNEAGAAATETAAEVTTAEATIAESIADAAVAAYQAETAGVESEPATDPVSRGLSTQIRSAGSTKASGQTDTSDHTGWFGSGFHLPAIVITIFKVLLAVVLLTAVAALLIYLKTQSVRREEAARAARYQRRQERLDDIGMSSEDFSQLVERKRSDSALRQTKPARRPKRHKSFLDAKR